MSTIIEYNKYCMSFCGGCTLVRAVIGIIILFYSVMGHSAAEIKLSEGHLDLSDNRLSGQVQLQTGGYIFEEDTINDQQTGGRSSVKFNFQYNLIPETLFFISKINLNLDVGHKENFYSKEDKESIKIKQFFINFHPYDFANLHLGVLGAGDFLTDSQGKLRQQHLVSSNAFVGASEQLFFSSLNNLYFTFFQSIPNSNSNSLERSQNSQTPTFLAITAGGEIEFSKKIILEPQVSAFKFSQLPSKVAYESSKHGNLIDSTGSNSKFRESFAGYMSSFNLKFLEPVESVEFNMLGEWSDNLSAGKNSRSQNLLLGAKWSQSDQFTLKGSVATYFIEREMYPAYYVTGSTGTNRIAHKLALEFGFPSSYFSVKTAYSQYETIKEDRLHGDRNDIEVMIQSAEINF